MPAINAMNAIDAMDSRKVKNKVLHASVRQAKQVGVTLGVVIAFFCSTAPAASLAAEKGGEPGRTSESSLAQVPPADGGFLSYERAVQIGLEQHPLLRRAHASALAAKAVTEQSKAKQYPQVDAYALQTGGRIRPLSAFNIAGAQNKPTSYVENIGARVDQLIYDFGQTAHRILAEQAAHEAAEKDILTNKAVIILRVQQAYLNSLRQKRLVDIAEEMVRERGVIRDQVALLYKRELRSKLDLNLASIELRNAEVQLLQAKNELKAAFASLNNAMGVGGAQEYTLQDEIQPLEIEGPLGILVAEAKRKRPELLKNGDRIRQADENLKVAESLKYPTITALGLYGMTHFSDAPLNQYAGSHPGQTNLWWGAAARLSVPLFTGFLIENRVAEARQKMYKAEKEKLDISNNVAAEVTDAFFTRQAVMEQVTVEKREVQTATSALDLAEERYRQGLASIVEVTTATTALMEAKVRLSEARYAFQATDAALAFATGRGYLKH